MTYILFTTAPDGKLLSFEQRPEDVAPAVGDYLGFDERAHGVPEERGVSAFRVRQVILWHLQGRRTTMVRADPVEVDEPSPTFAGILAAFAEAGGAVDPADRISTANAQLLLDEAPP
jgi:hypothetical protein